MSGIDVQLKLFLHGDGSFHDMTTQIPHYVSVAVKRNSRLPSLDYPPIEPHRFSNETYSAGIEEYIIDEVPVKVYCPEKTLADCFKFRNRIGMDVVLEALRLYRTRRTLDIEKLIEYAGICRVKNIMRPYLEAIV